LWGLVLLYFAVSAAIAHLRSGRAPSDVHAV
jgi:hypothetical protein